MEGAGLWCLKSICGGALAAICHQCQRTPMRTAKQVWAQLQNSVQQQVPGALIGIEAVDIGKRRAGLSEHDVEAATDSVRVRPVLDHHSPDMPAMQNPESALCEHDAVFQDATGEFRLVEPEEDAITTGPYGTRIGRQAEMIQQPFNRPR
jgi:hypothetical protein